MSLYAPGHIDPNERYVDFHKRRVSFLSHKLTPFIMRLYVTMCESLIVSFLVVLRVIMPV